MRENADRAGSQILHGNTVVVAIAGHEGDLGSVRRHPRARVVRGPEGYALHAFWIGDIELVDLRTAGAIGSEIDALAIRTPGGLGIYGRVVGQARECLR